jgi:hypothetical protein
MATKLSQCDKIVEYMKKYGGITQLQAYVDIGCVRLPSRIYDLKRKGYAIRREMIKVKNREDEYVPIARYSLADTITKQNERI